MPVIDLYVDIQWNNILIIVKCIMKLNNAKTLQTNANCFESSDSYMHSKIWLIASMQ